MKTYSYDINGRLSESTGLDPMGKTVSKLVNKYDDNSNLAEKLWMNTSGMVNSRFKYTYDNNNRIKEETKFRGENDR